MARDWQSTFDAWGAPPSATEQTEIKRTEDEIVRALTSWGPLKDKRIRVYAKGSHRRGTNVRRGSDVDIAVELRGTEPTGESFHTGKFFKAAGLTDEQLGLHSVARGYTVQELKRDVYDALVNAYGAGVTWANKCIQIRESKTTLPADVVACETYRRYDDVGVYNEGIRIVPDKGSDIINWPKQDDDNGTAKNGRTSNRFKRAVRGVKALENEMTDNGFIEEVPSFMIESAVYNVADARFDSSSNFTNCIHVLHDMAKAAGDKDVYSKWVEVNNLKFLFNDLQPWRIDDMIRLVDRAITYIEAA